MFGAAISLDKLSTAALLVHQLALRPGVVAGDLLWSCSEGFYIPQAPTHDVRKG